MSSREHYTIRPLTSIQGRRISRQQHLAKRRRQQFCILIALILFCFIVGSVWNGVSKQWSDNPQTAWMKMPDNFYTPKLLQNNSFALTPALTPLPLKGEDTDLTNKLSAIVSKLPLELKAHIFFFDYLSGNYVDINGSDAVSAASVIKLPVLFEYFLKVESGEITPFSHVMYQDFEQAEGSGMLQYRLPGQPLLAKDVATMMIQSSDNTCTNMLIYTLGGTEALNNVFETMGLGRTRIGNWLPDLGGTNVISMRNMATLLYNFTDGTALSESSKAQAMEILKGTHNRGLIPSVLPKDVVVAHKTGDIGSSLGNSALVMLPDGKKYILAVQVERPHNDYRAKTLIVDVSKVVYDTVKSRSYILQR